MFALTSLAAALSLVPADSGPAWLTVLLLFVLAATVTSIMHAMGKCPVFVPLICLCVAMLVQVLPKD